MGRPKGSGVGLPGQKPFPMWERLNAFYKQVTKGNPGECWIWNGSVGNHGYGVFSFAAKHPLAHRFAYTVNIGPIPHGMCVCHKCDNKKCVNHNHFFLGTKNDNNQDMFRKGRGRWPGRSNITTDQVRQIRAMHVPYYVSGRVIAERLNLPYWSVQCALSKYKWKSIPRT